MATYAFEGGAPAPCASSDTISFHTGQDEAKGCYASPDESCTNIQIACEGTSAIAATGRVEYGTLTVSGESVTGTLFILFDGDGGSGGMCEYDFSGTWQ